MNRIDQAGDHVVVATRGYNVGENSGGEEGP